MRLLAVIGVMVLALPVGAFAQSAPAEKSLPSGQEPLALESVLESSAKHFPAILEKLAERRAAAGKIEETQGAFDLVFNTDAYDRVGGFWTGGEAETTVTQPLRPLGATVYGGYRVSDGTLPVYEDQNFTNTGGEFKLGTYFSLLQDRAIDDRRFAVDDARLAYDQADLQVLATRIGIQHKALIAYWRWVWSGRQLQVYEELLRIAQKRQTGLEEEVRSGARAEIFLVENRQNIARRQRLTVEARQQFLAAANRLSFYYRDGKGDPVIPQEGRLPAISALQDIESLLNTQENNVARILEDRPELRVLRTRLERARRRISLRRNDLKPELNLSFEISRDLGAIQEGGSSRDSTDTIIGLQFSVPLQRRQARGQLRQAQAELEALQQRQRQVADEIEIDIRNVLMELDMAEDIVDITRQEVEQARTLQQAERDRFAGGASDFFLVNVREETTADARVRFYRALLDTRIARANYDAAFLNLERLGLGPDAIPR